jgi:hypothetical protein
MVKTKITQIEKILELTNLVKQARVLFFIAGSDVNRQRIKSDRKILKKKRFTLYKTNIYRGAQVFNAIPMFKYFLSSIRCFFFIAYAKNNNQLKKLLNIFELPLKHMKPLFAIQNKTFLTKQRLKNPKNKNLRAIVAPPLAINPCYVLFKNLLGFLKVVFVELKIKTINFS